VLNRRRVQGAFGRAIRVAAVLSGFAIGACATLGMNDEKVVQQKATERWNAIVANDLRTAYELISPAGRALVSYEAYAESVRRGFHKSARVTDVRCTSSEVCDVTLELEYERQGRRFKTPFFEKWVRQDSQWWLMYQR
jgi:hypothetical protein